MCSSSKPKVTQVPDPVITPAAPPPEPVATAPVTQDEGVKRTGDRESKRKGTSSLRIDLNLGDVPSSNGLSIPR